MNDCRGIGKTELMLVEMIEYMVDAGFEFEDGEDYDRTT